MKRQGREKWGGRGGGAPGSDASSERGGAGRGGKRPACRLAWLSRASKYTFSSFFGWGYSAKTSRLSFTPTTPTYPIPPAAGRAAACAPALSIAPLTCYVL